MTFITTLLYYLLWHCLWLYTTFYFFMTEVMPKSLHAIKNTVHQYFNALFAYTLFSSWTSSLSFQLFFIFLAFVIIIIRIVIKKHELMSILNDLMVEMKYVWWEVLSIVWTNNTLWEIGIHYKGQHRNTTLTNLFYVFPLSFS